MAKSIIIADDHPLVLEGYKSYLASAGFAILDTAHDGNEAFNKICRQQPDFAILDMEMPVLKGLEVAAYLHQNKVDVKVIILTLHSAKEIFDAVGKTIDGYLLKEDALDEILKCIRDIELGNHYVSSKIKQSSLASAPDALKVLSASEIKILQYIAKKMTSREIADTLFLSPRTVQKHRENIIRKLDITPGANNLLLWVSDNRHLF
ncbi:response regulator transcription factor [Flavobacterium selenitireducens]|uniref:response regulator transcription factor n=1 Tax=Flavobacterium selenitireducens TaxID=2722704 RepID=UPI00168BF565|nr:response regulator transcription factor [Flavobacterium selenitireducens]MBD3583513.1 response regulator transcription factor [Flavobacterium selenitireducens]